MPKRRTLLLARGSVAVLPVCLLTAFVAAYTIVNPSLFSEFQLQTVGDQIAPLVLVSLGELLVVLVGGIDISVAAVLSLANVVFVASLGHVSPYVAALAALGVGAGCGLCNGLLVVFIRLPTIVVTLATAFIFGALALEVLDRPGGLVATSVVSKTSGEVWPYVPTSFIWIAATAILLWLVLNRTVAGRLIYGVGSNSQGVRAAGSTSRTPRLLAFTLGGLLTAIGGIVLAGSTATGDPHAGNPYLLNAIAAVALGGASFFGGVGSVAGTVCAATILALIGNLLFFLGINSYWQYVIGSALIIVAVGAPFLGRRGLDALRRQRTA
jgi:ribose transport system permease protein